VSEQHISTNSNATRDVTGTINSFKVQCILCKHA